MIETEHTLLKEEKEELLCKCLSDCLHRHVFTNKPALQIHFGLSSSADSFYRECFQLELVVQRRHKKLLQIKRVIIMVAAIAIFTALIQK